MKRKFSASWASLLLACLLLAPSASGEDSWLQGWNPFNRRDDADRGRAALSDEPTLPFGIPKPSMPRIGRAQNERSNSPDAPSTSPLKRMNSGTRSFFTKTRETLTPPWMRGPKKPPTYVPGAGGAPASTARRGSFFQKFRPFGSSAAVKPSPRQEVNSVGDFLKLPRVQP